MSPDESGTQASYDRFGDRVPSLVYSRYRSNSSSSKYQGSISEVRLLPPSVSSNCGCDVSPDLCPLPDSVLPPEHEGGEWLAALSKTTAGFTEPQTRLQINESSAAAFKVPLLKLALGGS